MPSIVKRGELEKQENNDNDKNKRMGKGKGHSIPLGTPEQLEQTSVASHTLHVAVKVPGPDRFHRHDDRTG
jgi:hypothetical protein